MGATQSQLIRSFIVAVVFLRSRFLDRSLDLFGMYLIIDFKATLLSHQ